MGGGREKSYAFVAEDDPAERLEFRKVLGEGSFGIVQLAHDKVKDTLVAVKFIAKSSIRTPKAERQFRKEITALKRLSSPGHPNVIKLFTVLEDAQNLYMLLEYASHGELFDYIVDNTPIGEVHAAYFFHGMVSATLACHLQGVVHRDLKPENFLLDRGKYVRLSDFGFAGFQERGAGRTLRTPCGSPTYAAPEIFRGEAYDESVDVWSLGVNLYVLVTGRSPWGDRASPRVTRERIQAAAMNPLPLSVSPECQDLIGRMVVADPAGRASLEDVLDHPFFQKAVRDSAAGVVAGDTFARRLSVAATASSHGSDAADAAAMAAAASAAAAAAAASSSSSSSSSSAAATPATAAIPAAAAAAAAGATPVSSSAGSRASTAAAQIAVAEAAAKAQGVARPGPAEKHAPLRPSAMSNTTAEGDAAEEDVVAASARVGPSDETIAPTPPTAIAGSSGDAAADSAKVSGTAKSSSGTASPARRASPAAFHSSSSAAQRGGGGGGGAAAYASPSRSSSSGRDRSSSYAGSVRSGGGGGGGGSSSLNGRSGNGAPSPRPGSPHTMRTLSTSPGVRASPGMGTASEVAVPLRNLPVVGEHPGESASPAARPTRSQTTSGRPSGPFSPRPPSERPASPSSPVSPASHGSTPGARQRSYSLRPRGVSTPIGEEAALAAAQGRLHSSTPHSHNNTHNQQQLGVGAAGAGASAEISSKLRRHSTSPAFSPGDIRESNLARKLSTPSGLTHKNAAGSPGGGGGGGGVGGGGSPASLFNASHTTSAPCAINSTPSGWTSAPQGSRTAPSPLRNTATTRAARAYPQQPSLPAINVGSPNSNTAATPVVHTQSVHSSIPSSSNGSSKTDASCAAGAAGNSGGTNNMSSTAQRWARNKNSPIPAVVTSVDSLSPHTQSVGGSDSTFGRSPLTSPTAVGDTSPRGSLPVAGTPPAGSAFGLAMERRKMTVGHEKVKTSEDA